MAAKAAAPNVLSTQTTYPAANAPTFTAGFEVRRWTFAARNSTGDGVLFFSFDGVEDHGALPMSGGTLASVVLAMFQPASKLWVRVVGATSDLAVAITAESTPT